MLLLYIWNKLLKLVIFNYQKKEIVIIIKQIYNKKKYL